MAGPGTGQIGSGTLEGLEEFCDWVVGKGLMRSAAVEPLRSATKQILQTVEPDTPDIDLRTIDADELMRRFETLAGHKYAPDSLRAYRNRFNRAIELYRQYLDKGPAGFKPPAGRAPRRRAAESTKNRPISQNGLPAAPAAPQASAGASAQSLIDYPFPLRTGVMAHLYLPPTLEKDDAERLAAYVRALVFDPQRQIEAGKAS